MPKEQSQQDLGSAFLHQRNPQFHASDEVESVVGYLRAGGERVSTWPADKISAYLGFLADRDYANDGVLTGDQDSIARQIEHNVVKFEDVPEAYFELQRRIAWERGEGDIHIAPAIRKQLIEAIQSDQRSALETWAEYVGGEDGGYPDWFRTYVWNSVTRLGTYDKEKQEFGKRSRGTTALYPELNREALAYVFDVLDKKVKGIQVGDVNNEKLQKVLKSANFGKLYAHAVMEVTPDSPELKNSIEGSWTKFNQSHDERTARRLAESLQGHGTGWCTAGISTAVIQLKGGDFYVYYTRDKDGKDTVPRVAIRMEDGEVEEVRGVNPGQELEPVMVDLTLEKMKDLPGNEEYKQKADDMKRVTALDKKLRENPEAELTTEEILFLYEFERNIQGFGYDKDPRIKQLLASRDLLEDMAILAGVDPDDHEQLVANISRLEKERKYFNRYFDKVLERCWSLSPQLARTLMNGDHFDEVRTHINSFNGLNDEMARELMDGIRGIDLPAFDNLSEETFYKLVDRFNYHSRAARNQEKNTLEELLENIDRFVITDPQKIASFLMDKNRWYDAARLPSLLGGLDAKAISDRLINEGQTWVVANNIKNFPHIDHTKFANDLLGNDPQRLAMTLRDLDVDRNHYAHELIDAGEVFTLSQYASNLEEYDDGVRESIANAKAEEAARLKALQEAAAERERKGAEESRQRQERWDDMSYEERHKDY